MRLAISNIAWGIAEDTSVAKLLGKFGGDAPEEVPLPGRSAGSLGQLALLARLRLIWGAFLLYAAALARLPLNVVHPVLTSGAVATVALFSVLIFREPFHWTTGAGILFVIAGVALITARVA